MQILYDGEKQDGKEYEPDSLTALHRGIQKYLNEKKVTYNILTDKEFEQSRKVLAAKRKQLTKMGLGNKPNATREVEQNEIDKFFETGFFGQHNAQALQRTM